MTDAISLKIKIESTIVTITRKSQTNDTIVSTMSDVINTSSNTNVTSFKNRANPGTPLDLFFDVVLSTALMFSVYTLCALSLYEWKLRRKYHATTADNARSRGLRKTDLRERKAMEFRFIAPWLRMLCILGALAALMRCINDFLYYKLDHTSDASCTNVKNLGVAWLALVDSCVYLFLWLRQRVLYAKQCLKQLANIYIRIISWVSLLLIIAIFVSFNTLLFWRKFTYNESIKKCIGTNHTVESIIPHMWTGSSTTLHILLVFLYVYPLLKHSFSLKNHKKLGKLVEKETKHKRIPSKKSKQRQSLMHLVNRCIVISVLCLITDEFVMLFGEYWVVAGSLSKLRHSLYNINATCNIILIVMSFSKRRKMLFPWFEKKPKNETSEDKTEKVVVEQSFVSIFLSKKKPKETSTSSSSRQSLQNEIDNNNIST